jgi:DDE superfamily endonuclease
MLFWDEKPFELYVRRRLSWHKKGTPLVRKPTVKYPPKLQVGAGISRKGKTKILIWKGRGKSKQYCDRLEESVVPFIKNKLKNPHRFFHDLDTTHKSAYTQKWLAENGVNGQFCPARSPDLNAIEYVWNILEKRVMDHNPTTEEEMERWIKKEWDSIDQKVIDHTIDHITHVIPKMISARGDNNY